MARRHGQTTIAALLSGLVLVACTTTTSETSVRPTTTTSTTTAGPTSTPVTTDVATTTTTTTSTTSTTTTSIAGGVGRTEITVVDRRVDLPDGDVVCAPSGVEPAAAWGALFDGRLGPLGRFLAADTGALVDIGRDAEILLLGDTLLSSGARAGAGTDVPATTRAIHNSAIVRVGHCFGFVTGPNGSWMYAPGTDYYWPGAALVVGDFLLVYVAQVASTGRGFWDFTGVDVDVAVIDLTTFAVETVIDSGPWDDWGAQMRLVGNGQVSHDDRPVYAYSADGRTVYATPDPVTGTLACLDDASVWGPCDRSAQRAVPARLDVPLGDGGFVAQGAIVDRDGQLALHGWMLGEYVEVAGGGVVCRTPLANPYGAPVLYNPHGSIDDEGHATLMWSTGGSPITPGDDLRASRPLTAPLHSGRSGC